VNRHTRARLIAEIEAYLAFWAESSSPVPDVLPLSERRGWASLQSLRLP
jgi:hypothetical protein